MSDEVIGPDIAYIDVQSREQQEIARALSIMPEKEKAGKFDVFLCYHSADQQEAERIAGVLRELGVLPWIDAREIKPGDEVVTRLDSVLGTVPSALIMIGDQLGAWEQHEFQALLNRRLRAGTDSGVRPVRLIPMVLSSAKAASPGMPELLRSFHSVDLRDPESFDARLRRLAAVIREESDR
ncbi:MAG TPA: toll/interleukin-1 receptor domain-containing protein [Thermoanaerobaculia bacterium]|nr:toll/interleukin-1 receptor domain-containing protein [Thermoanaerobaculia bacterium]